MKIRPRFLSFRRRRFPALALAVAMALAGPAKAFAADPGSWWVYVANDDAADVRTLLGQGADPNVRHRSGQPALMRAVVDGAWAVFDAIAADPRTDLNAENPAGETPLMYLALAGQTERAAGLIGRGAQVNRLGWTPLHYAASKGQLGVARLLLQHRAIVNAPSPRGVTPLMMAGYSGNREMVNLLLRAGADATTHDLDGKDAADWALEGKQRSLARDLRETVARAEAARDARRSTAAGAASAPAAVAPQGEEPRAQPAEPSSAPRPAPSDGPAVGGVSNLKLNDYDKEAD